MLFAVMILMGAEKLILPFFLAAAIHELGHLTALYAFKGMVTGICFNLCGIKIEHNSACLSYAKEFVCIIFGPLFGIIAAIIAARLNYSVFAGISFAVSVFNLLPARPLDGGQAVFCVARSLLPLYTAEKICSTLDAAVTGAMLCAGAYSAVMTKGNLTLLFMGAVMLFTIVKNEEIV